MHSVLIRTNFRLHFGNSKIVIQCLINYSDIGCSTVQKNVNKSKLLKILFLYSFKNVSG